MTTLRIPDGKARLTVSPTGTCKVCGDTYAKFRSTQTICAKIKCATQVGKLQRKAEKAETKRRKEAAKPRKKWLQEAQEAVNKWVRLRDKAGGHGCISCSSTQGKENAGHYLSVGARPELRFEPLNIHLQCERCNTYLHGNLIDYRRNLIQRIGLAAVEWLESHHEPKKYTVADLKQIITEYRAKAKELEREATNGD